MKFEFLNGFKKLFDNKKFLVAFSVVLAIVFWLVIEITENPSRDITLSDVPVTLIEKQDDNNNKLVPVGDYNDKVTVMISGPGYIVGTVSKDDVTVSVKSYKDVEKPDRYTLLLEATVGKNGCTAVPSPNFIEVTYDYILEADIPVEIDVSELDKQLTGDTANKYSDLHIERSVLKNEADGAELPTLKISGPSEVVSKVAKVKIKPDLKVKAFERKTDNFEEFTLEFLDKDSKPIVDQDASLLTYNTETYVRVVVYKTAEVQLKPTFINKPGSYDADEIPNCSLKIFNEINNKYEAISSVKVKGPIDAVDSLISNGLLLSPIDFTKVTPGNTKFNVSFVLADGVSVVDGTEEITVSLNIGTVRQKTVTVDPSRIQFYGLGEGMTATTSYKKGISVTVCGRYAVLSTVNADDIVISVDCTGMAAASSGTKPLTVTITGSVEAWAVSINPVDINVTVK